jgi:proline iminopeptidase
MNEGVSRVFPDYWQEFVSLFDENEKNNLLDSLCRRIFSDDRDVQLRAAKAWSLWSGRIVTHSLPEEYILDDEDEDKLINDVKIEIHYAKNSYFIEENQIINNFAKIPNIPITIIHGRNDLTCLPESSWSLHKALSDSKLIIVPNAGHLAGEPAMTDALVRATDQMSGFIK